ncbi:TlpA disulfide reductase family protein [Mucilaginibacter sp. 10I4]|uniref:TlpA family protein disulfide reductase n=1 Tax=Mucilaginibacter sp. 10I4 TaxID=3048580 RepID=UPI002B236F6A|nr:TlpA disulfide reductase family protein [Mucilaginibacter sp. 10I4]MEB0261820.1 TlpA disulfide reductase family protein [Mucilaginibacter sp. 10I4]
MKALILLILSNWAIHSFAQSNSAIIKGNLNFTKDGDCVVLEINEHPLFNKESNVIKIVKKVNHGTFLFNISIHESPLYVSLVFPSKGVNFDGSKNIYRYLIEKGDHIIFSSINGLQFSGRGSSKWIVQNNLIPLNKRIMVKSYNNDSAIGLIDKFKFIDSSLVLKVNFILKKRKELSNAAIKLLIADNIALSRVLKSLAVRNSGADKKDISTFLLKYNEMPLSKYFTREDSTFVLPISNDYCESLIEKFRLDSCFQKNERFSVTKCYHAFKKLYSGLLRDKMLTLLLYKYQNSPENITDCIRDAEILVKEPIFHEIIVSLKVAAAKNGNTYNFTLPDTSGKMVSLSNFRGKLVILDFWFTGCTPCRILSKKLKEMELIINKENAIVISINVDINRSRWIESVKSGQYTSPQEINLNTGTLSKEHPLIKHYMVNGYPTLLLFNREGKRLKTPQNPSIDDGKDLLSLLKDN